LIFLLAALLLAASAPAQVTVLSRATVIDGSGAPPQKDITIVMENGRIRDMGPAPKISTPAGATVLDLTGKFIVPSIINAHGHVGAKTEPQLRQYALYGVTTATSMQTDPDEVVQVREAQKKGELRGARVSTVKYRFAPDPEVVTPEQARAKVDQIVAAGADYIKVWVDTAASAPGPSSAPTFAPPSWSRRASMASSPSVTPTSSPTPGCWWSGA
jgi:cytosine/adenosine deaminase-related metal-dependent hydrolase